MLVSKFYFKFLQAPEVFQYVIFFTASISIVCNGLNAGWPTPSLPILLGKDSPIPTTNDQGSWLATVTIIGSVCGSFSGALVLDSVGRKSILLLSSLPYFVAWLAIAFVSSIPTLLCARFLAGVGNGLAFCSAIVYVTEMAHPKIRGFIGSSITVTNVFGIFLVNVVGSYLSIRMTALVCSVVPILCFVMFVWMPESPYYLVIKGDIEKAAQNLSCFRHPNEADEELKRIEKSFKEESREVVRYFELFTKKSNREALYLTLVLRFAQQFSGASAITTYSQIIFQEMGTDMPSQTASIIFLGVQLVMSIVCSVLVDKTGRKPLVIVSTIGVIITLLIKGSYFFLKQKTDIDLSGYSVIPAIAMIAFIIMYSIGLYTIPLLLSGEVFPTNIKPFAVSVADLCLCILQTLATKMFQLTKDGVGLYVSFFAFSVCDVVSLIYLVIYMPETSGKTLEEVQQLLKGKVTQSTNL